MTNAIGFEDMFDDPVPDPYLEMDDEVFEMYFESGVVPGNIGDPEEADRYRTWLARKSSREE